MTSTLLNKRNKYLPLYFILSVGILVIVFAFNFVTKSAKLEEEGHFRLEAQNFIHLIDQDLKHSFYILDSVDAFYRSSNYVDREEFRIYANVMLDGFKALELLQWLPLVKDEDKTDFIDKAIASGRKNFQILELDSRDLLQASVNHKEYLPVYYSRPYSWDHSLLGLDWNSIPQRRELLQKALVKGISFDKLDNIEKLPNDTVTIVKTIYKTNGKKELYGFLISFVDLQKIVETIQEKSPYLEICIKNKNSGDVPVYISSSSCQFDNDNQFSYIETIDIAGESFDFIVFPSRFYQIKIVKSEAIVIVCILIFFVGLLLKYTKDSIDRAELIESEVAQRTEALRRSNEELDRYGYIVSHDLKEPIRGIAIYLGMLMKKNKEKLDESSIELIETAIQLCTKSSDMLKSIHEYSRLGNVELAYKDTDLQKVLDDVLFSLDTFVKEHNAKVVVPRKLPVVNCDSVRIGEVFRNFITNGIKYNHQKEKVVEIGYEAKDKGSIWFYVKDNGDGIDEQHYKSIFEIFKRLGKADDGGTGVGLTLVQKIIERHGGRIKVESEIGKGTSFWFSLEPDL